MERAAMWGSEAFHLRGDLAALDHAEEVGSLPDEADVAVDQRAQALRVDAGRSEGVVEHGAEGGDAVLDEGDEDAALVLKIVVKQGVVDPGGLGDLRDAGGRVALLREDPSRHLQQPRPSGLRM